MYKPVFGWCQFQTWPEPSLGACRVVDGNWEKGEISIINKYSDFASFIFNELWEWGT
jgi:hypothetical protein